MVEKFDNFSVNYQGMLVDRNKRNVQESLIAFNWPLMDKFIEKWLIKCTLRQQVQKLRYQATLPDFKDYHRQRELNKKFMDLKRKLRIETNKIRIKVEAQDYPLKSE